MASSAFAFQFRRFPTYCYFIHSTLTRYCRAGFPHSDIHGSQDICSSPWLFAACRVLLRLLMPRHSPCALISLTFVGAICAPFASVISQGLSTEAHTAPFAPPLKTKNTFSFCLGRGGFAIELRLLDCYGLIAVLRIMQASQKFFARCCVTLKVPHSRLLAAPSRGALCCLAFLHLPLFSFQGAEKRVTRQVFGS